MGVGELQDTAELGPTVVLGMVALALLAGLIYLVRQTRQINNAVNNVGPGGVPLSERVNILIDRTERLDEQVSTVSAAQHAFEERGWSGLPADMSTAGDLTSTVRQIQAELAAINARSEQRSAAVDDKLKVLADYVGRVEDKVERLDRSRGL